MAGKPFCSTKTMKQTVLVRTEQATWFLAQKNYSFFAQGMEPWSLRAPRRKRREE